MKNLIIEFRGTTPLIMHSCQGVNPLHPLSVEMRKISKIRSKTDQDLAALSDLEWESSLYYDPNIGPYIPADNLEACIREGGKARKKGKDLVRGFRVQDMKVPLDYGEQLTLDELRDDFRFRDVRPMKVQTSRVMRTRARFNNWGVRFRAVYNEGVLSLQDVVNAIEYAGQFVGLCDSRPKYGSFEATITEVD